MTGMPCTVAATRPSCNILMADGSVKLFSDSNGDKFLNPGFPVPNNLTDAQYAVIGYRDSEVELPPTTIFNGVFLHEPPEALEVRITMSRGSVPDRLRDHLRSETTSS